jgi:protease I
MSATGKKVAVMIEGDFYENEIFYYQHRFVEDGINLHFLSRLWGNERLTFKGHEYQAPLECGESFEKMSDEVKGIICHGLWLCAPKAELVRGRRLTVHNNLIGDAKAYGADYVDEDVVVDRDLVTARTGGHCHLLARKIIDMLSES